MQCKIPRTTITVYRFFFIFACFVRCIFYVKRYWLSRVVTCLLALISLVFSFGLIFLSSVRTSVHFLRKKTSILEAMIQNKRYREKCVLIHLDTNETLFDHFRLKSYSQPKRIMMTMKQLTHLYPVMHRPIHRHANENISIPMQ